MPSTLITLLKRSSLVSYCLCGCDHYHMSVASAVACTAATCSGAYVVAVENGDYRELNGREEREFQLHMYGWVEPELEKKQKPEEKQDFNLWLWPKTDPEPTD